MFGSSSSLRSHNFAPCLLLFFLATVLVSVAHNQLRWLFVFSTRCWSWRSSCLARVLGRSWVDGCAMASADNSWFRGTPTVKCIRLRSLPWCALAWIDPIAPRRHVRRAPFSTVGSWKLNMLGTHESSLVLFFYFLNRLESAQKSVVPHCFLCCKHLR